MDCTVHGGAKSRTRLSPFTSLHFTLVQTFWLLCSRPTLYNHCSPSEILTIAVANFSHVFPSPTVLTAQPSCDYTSCRSLGSISISTPSSMPTPFWLTSQLTHKVTDRSQSAASSPASSPPGGRPRGSRPCLHTLITPRPCPYRTAARLLLGQPLQLHQKLPSCLGLTPSPGKTYLSSWGPLLPQRKEGPFGLQQEW